MKRILFGLIAFCMICTSCKKDQKKPVVTTGLYSVKFNVGFSQQLANFSTTRLKLNSTTPDTSLHNVDVLYYLVFDTNGNNIRNVKQVSGQSDFGTITDNLTPGTYTVVIAGGKTGLAVGNLDRGFNNSYLTYPDLSFYDTFYKKLTLTVSNSNPAQSVALDRIVALLEVNIEDPLPASARYLKVTLSTANFNFSDVYPRWFMFATSAPNAPEVAAAGSTILTSANSGTTNNKVSVFVLNTSLPFNADIICSKDVSPSYAKNPPTFIAEKFVNNITLQTNRKTILTGKLFGNTSGGSNGYQAQADTAWSTTTINKSF